MKKVPGTGITQKITWEDVFRDGVEAGQSACVLILLTGLLDRDNLTVGERDATARKNPFERPRDLGGRPVESCLGGCKEILAGWEKKHCKQ